MRSFWEMTYLIGVVLFSANLHAQQLNDGFITGSIVIKSTNKPLEFANVALFKLPDSSLVIGTMTDAAGKFYFDHVRDGSFYLLFSRIGFAETKTPSFLIDSQHKSQNLGKFSVNVTTLPADNIVVTAEKPTFDIAVDRKVYNIEKDIMSKSGSAGDLLQNIPSVSVDIDGNVSLRGSENVLILINGRSSPLMGKNRAAVLQQMPANSIERIEVITNPSAKYKPEGTSGIINLVLKKNTQAGLNGSLSSNGGLDSRYNGNIALNYNPGHFNLFGSYGMRRDSRHRYSIDSRRIYDQNNLTNSFLNQNNKGHARPLSYMATLGLDYNPNESNHMGVSGNYFFRDVMQNDNARNIFSNDSSAIVSDFLRSRHGREHEFENEGTLYYERSFGKEDHKLHIEYNISDKPEKEDNHFANTYFVPPQNPQYDNNLFKKTERQDQLSIEYANPMSENSTLEAGFTHEQNKQDIKNNAEYFDTTSQSFVTDLGKTNRFKYNDAIDAIYATFERSFGKISFLGGLRYEYAQNKSHLITGDSTYKNNYQNIYPSCHLGYQLRENSELQLNYSKRTNRPEGEDLNPFPEYRDPLNIDAGNPKLLPEYIHSIEFGWQLKNEQLSITPSIYYRYRYNGFTSVTEPLRDSILLTTMRNLSSDQSEGVELIINGSVGNYLDADLSANAFYNTIDASNIGFGKHKSVASWSGTFNINFKLRPTTVLQTNSYFRSTRLTPQGKYLANFVVNFGMRQDLFGEKLSLTLTVSDIFNSRIQKTQVRTIWLNSDAKFWRDSRIAFVGLTYHFGKATKRNEKKSLEYE